MFSFSGVFSFCHTKKCKNDVKDKAVYLRYTEISE